MDQPHYYACVRALRDGSEGDAGGIAKVTVEYIISYGTDKINLSDRCSDTRDTINYSMNLSDGKMLFRMRSLIDPDD